jgi:hypothetical protein
VRLGFYLPVLSAASREAVLLYARLAGTLGFDSGNSARTRTAPHAREDPLVIIRRYDDGAVDDLTRFAAEVLPRLS